MAMETYSLIVNLGSTSKKYALYHNKECLVSFHLERRASDCIVTTTKVGSIHTSPLLEEEYIHSLSSILHALHSEEYIDKKNIARVGIRVVAPGAFFAAHQPIDTKYIVALKKEIELDPLHIAPTLLAIQEIEKELPTSALYAIADTAFHASIDKEAYALPFAKVDCETFELQPFGYHGISLESIVLKLPRLFATTPKRIVVCHLGGGSSITAVSENKSIHTSMLYSPLGGALMSSRSGSIDPGALLALMQKKKMSVKETVLYLYTESGLKGISGITGDVPRLLELEESGDGAAKNALAHFTRSVAEEIAKQTVTLGGLDALIFSGTIGERSAVMRERIVSNLSFLNLSLDKTKNNVAIHEDVLIGDPHSKVYVATITSDELGRMAAITNAFSS